MGSAAVSLGPVVWAETEIATGAMRQRAISAKSRIMTEMCGACQTPRERFLGAGLFSLPQHGAGVADLELARRFEIERLDDAIDDEH